MFTERHNNSEINLQKPFNIAFNLFRAFHQKTFHSLRAIGKQFDAIFHVLSNAQEHDAEGKVEMEL